MNLQKTDVSIITPVYKGKKYLKNLLKIIEKTTSNVPDNQIEWILVNDFPEEEIELPSTSLKNLRIKLINNKVNLGIQKARINGIEQCTGKYILFLDQDDRINESALKIHLKNIEHSDVSVTNGYVESEDKSLRKIFSTDNQLKCTSNIKYYFYIGDIIVSPGMVMIRKKAIPKLWLEHTLTINGADDWLLWTLLLANKRRFATSYVPTYIHIDTGLNTSKNKSMMWKSTMEALKIFKDNNANYKKLCHIFERRIKMIVDFQLKNKNKTLLYLKNLDIASYVILYKIIKKIK